MLIVLSHPLAHTEYAEEGNIPEVQVNTSPYPDSAVGIRSSGVDNGPPNTSALAPSNSEPNGQMAFVLNFFFITYYLFIYFNSMMSI